MLVLARRRSQRILIGPDIVVEVLEVRGGVVRLGIDAPPHVSVHREEVAARIAAEAQRLHPPDTDATPTTDH